MAPCDAYTKLLESNHPVVVVIYENLTQKVMPYLCQQLAYIKI